MTEWRSWQAAKVYAESREVIVGSGIMKPDGAKVADEIVEGFYRIYYDHRRAPNKLREAITEFLDDVQEKAP